MEYRLSEYSPTERKVDDREGQCNVWYNGNCKGGDFTPVCNYLLGRVVEVYHGSDEGFVPEGQAPSTPPNVTWKKSSQKKPLTTISNRPSTCSNAYPSLTVLKQTTDWEHCLTSLLFTFPSSDRWP
ncbi:hypothetical protein TNCV_324331 [Trichonephila clavipes]|nr:hypothetical protein TNCV_324331 [Trichonephila clavipes]